MKNDLTTTNQNAKLALNKSNSLLSNNLSKEPIESFENFGFSVESGHGCSINSLTVTPDGKTIVSASSDHTIKLWEISSGKEIQIIKGHSSDINSVAISFDGKYIVSGDGTYGASGTIKLWELKSGKELRTFNGFPYSVESVAITPDGKYIVSIDNNTIDLWEISSGKISQTFEVYEEEYEYDKSSVVTTPDGKYIISGGYEGIIQLWEISSGKLLCSYVSYKNGEWLAWTPEGYYNCSDGSYKYFSFVDDSKEIPEAVPQNHPVYQAKKKEILLSNYIGGANPYAKNPPPQTEIGEYPAPKYLFDEDDDHDSPPYAPQIDIDDDEIPSIRDHRIYHSHRR